jgi:von Willebrand factor type D domain
MAAPSATRTHDRIAALAAWDSHAPGLRAAWSHCGHLRASMIALALRSTIAGPDVEAAMGRVTSGLIVAVAVGGALAWGAPAQAADPVSVLRLQASPVQSSFSPGDPVRLHLSVINGSGTECDLLSRADGALQVVSAKLDGHVLAPAFGRSLPIDGVQSLLARSAKATAPDATMDIDVTARDFLDTMTPLRDGSGVLVQWPVSAVGRYELTLIYEVPPAAGERGCVGASDAVTVVFNVGNPPSYRWIIYVAGAALFVALAVLVVFLLLRRRPRGRAKAVAATALLALVGTTGLITLDVRPASANVIYRTDPNDQTAQAVYDNCSNSILAFDPSLIATLAGPDVTVIIFAGLFGESESRRSASGGPRDTTILWDPHDQSPFAGEPGVTNNPCTALYHELIHALDRATTGDNDEQCNNTGVLFDEVRATAAENRFRAYLGGSNKPRHKYDGKPIPPSEADCFPPPPGQRRADNGSGGTCRALNGGCGSTNGDPHLVTYDGRFYDFHGIGEFVATQASTGTGAADLEIQVRQRPFLDSRTVAVNSAIAIRVGATRLGFYLSSTGIAVHRDGQTVTVPSGDTALPGGATLTRGRDPYAGDAYDITWPDGSTASMARLGSWGLRLSVQLTAARANTVAGLLGNFDGDPANDPAPAGGAPLGETLSYDKLYPAFADSWRITDATSLFDYEPGQNTKTLTDRTFPDRFVKAADLPADRVAQARTVCGWLGVTNPDLLDACVLDVVLTGLASFALAAGDVQEQVPPGPATGFGVDGAAAAATIVQAGATARLTFAGTAGTRVYVMADSATLPDQCGVITLRGPDDTALASGCIIGGKGEVDGTVLPTTGTYTIVVDPAGDATGTVNLRIVSSVDQTGALRIDGPEVEATIAQPGQTAQLTFAGQTGQKVFVDATSATIPDQCGLPVLKGPDGTTLTGGCVIGAKGYIDGTTLPATGQYTLVIDPAESGTGRVRLRVIGVTDQHATMTVGGEATAVIGQPGGISYFTFTLPSATKVTVNADSSTLPDQCGIPTLRDSDNNVIASGCVINATGGIQTTAILPPGQYTIEVNPADRNVGQLRLRLTAQPS